MRNAILQLPDARTDTARQEVLRAAIRQLERADIYIAAVEFMGLGDPEAERIARRMRTELHALRTYLGAPPAGIRE
jgi:hypothetical protein